MVAKKSAAVSKAKNASKAVLKGGKFTLKKKKVMTSATFRRPKTKITPRKPKVSSCMLHEIFCMSTCVWFFVQLNWFVIWMSTSYSWRQLNFQYARKSVNTINTAKLDKYSIIKNPLTTESAMKKIEDNNTLVFLVNIRANKPQIKMAVKQLYDIDVAKVNTLIR